jgi:cell division septal protein FtsQ
LLTDISPQAPSCDSFQFVIKLEQDNKRRRLMTLVRALWGMMAFLVLAGIITLAMWGIPAPATRIEKVIPNEKLPK